MTPLNHENPKQPVTSEEFDTAIIAIKNAFDQMATKQELSEVKQELSEVREELGEVREELGEVKSIQEKTLSIQESILSVVQSIDQKLAPLQDLPERVARLEEDVYDLKYRRKVNS